MLQALRLALATWWDRLFEYAILNFLWVAFTLSLVTGPPALAAFYQMTADSADRHEVDSRSYLGAIRKLFIPAWRWGLLQLVIYGIGFFNFLYYSYASGTLWAVLRLVWFIGLSVWTVLNFLYWPFYLEQTDQRMRNTYRNTLVLCATRPVLVLGFVTVSVGIIFFSAMTVILFAFAVMPVIALFGTYVIRQELADYRQRYVSG